MESDRSELNILIAAGGTGGHLLPAQALALELIKKYPTMRVTFMGMGLEKNPCFKRDLFSFLEIQSGTPFNKNPIHLFKALLKLAQGIKHSLKWMKKMKPDLIVGFGSFHSFPSIYAAKLKHIPIILFESNVFPGRVNRLCSKWAKVSAIQFSRARSYLKSDCISVQMPLLKKVEGLTKKKGLDYLGLEGEKLTLLIFGGSQGAESINHLVCGALEPLLLKGVDFQVIHIAGDPKRIDKLEKIYTTYQIPAAVKVFENHMEYAWVAADLSISRAGSGTLSELIEFSVPSILIPYPFAAENHQSKNAEFVTEEIKGGVTLKEHALTGSILADTIFQLVENKREKLKEMKKALKSFKEKESKQDLCSLVINTL